MEITEIEILLRSLLEEYHVHYDPPSKLDWVNLESKFSCVFSDEFMVFINLMSKFSFPGDILNVATGNSNGNDLIAFTYDYEMKQGIWKQDFIPFYSVGNGDYFCLSASESPNSPVYYFYHDDFRVERYSENFKEWLENLPQFLS